jgi:hypothetical protein
MARRFSDRPHALEQLRVQLRAEQPTLHVRVVDDRVVIAGTLRILHEGREIDGYKIEVHLAADHPAGLPTVYEIGGRIPRHADHHINPDGSLCLGVPDELHLAGGAWNIRAFLHGPLRNYLLGHSYFVQEGRWPGGEWAHGGAGVRQFYAAITAKKPWRVAATLVAKALVPLAEIDFDAPCFCGSRLRVRTCHGPVIQRLRFFVPVATLRSSLVHLVEP